MAIVTAACDTGSPASLSSTRLQAVRAADRAYAEAWLANDRERVMATLTSDAVIMPSGIPALQGHPAIGGFWWPPDSPATRVTEFTLRQSEADGHGDLAFVRGEFTLRFNYDGKDYANRGDYLSLLRQQPDRSWKITHRTWNDLSSPASTPAQEAINSAWRTHIDAAVRKDLAEVLEIYADDALYHVTGMPATLGRPALDEMEARSLAGGDVLEARHTTDSLRVFGDVAYELGTISGPIRPHGEPAGIVTFHFMALWRLQADGAWRVAHFAGQPDGAEH
jgi:ketosteroid isomerase-like protein